MEEKMYKELMGKYANRDEWKDVVYELMNGNFDLERFPMEESNYIENEFEAGSYCDQIYEELYKAKQRIYKRMGKVQDNDIELIILDMLQICRHLSMKMYDYGEAFAQKNV